MRTAHTSYAEKVTVSREAFARAFDAVAASRPGDDYLDFKIAALGAVDDRAAFAAAFEQAKDKGFLGSLVAYLAELRYLDDDALMLLPQDAGQIFTPQGMTKAMTALVDTGKMVRGLSEAARRVCLVQVGGAQPSQGTGFLVGPQTVLTNWHVVHSLIDASTGKAKPGSVQNLTCSFDFIGAYGKATHAAVEDWLVEWSPMTPGAAGYPDMTKHKPDTLDFCVIRLKGAPGRMRNWYDLAKAVVPQLPVPGSGAPARPFFVVQHPGGLVQHTGVTSDFTVNPAKAYEFHHQAPTIAGSSGGICLDAKFELVALHQGELKNNKDVFLTNVAISATVIAARASNAAASIVAQDDLLWRLNDRSAVIGRTGTIDKALAMNRPGAAKPFLLVRGAAQSGKSFTRELIEHRLEYSSRIVIRIDGDKLPASGRQLAMTVLGQAGSTESDKLPILAGAGTTPVATYRGTFMSDFSRLLRDGLPKDGQGVAPLIWLVIDRLREETVTPSDAENFLEALYVTALPEIRFVLIGLKGSLPQVDQAKVEAEDLLDPRTPSLDEVKVYLQCLFAERNIAPLLGELDRLATIALATARDLPDDRPLLPKLAGLLTKTYNPASDQWNP
ncbi:trypsin-like peptidase domain-containing protein [Mesorhizobium australicum]|uniref:trypsin-like peptidase domain-containing protein n=1 Tax=Mesorhizobium australicum TaxID=536018 RepID=UPI00333CECB9